MKKIQYFLLSVVVWVVCTVVVVAGNPDRQGEAGAAQLLMNPWARSSGLHTMTTANVVGAEAMQLNVAGISRINKTEVVLSHTQYLRGTDIGLNALGFAQKIGKSSAIGLSLMSVDFGEIRRTTTLQPEGTGTTFSPRFVNIGLGFSHIFENRVSVGVLARAVSEGIDDVTASAVCLDAGVQYVSGDRDNFKFGISLRNVGSRMQFKGEGLSTEVSDFPAFDGPHGLVLSHRPNSFELQSMLNIGLSYDFFIGEGHRLTMIGNYTSNAFSQDNIGGGLEFSYKELIMVRGGYKFDFGQFANNGQNLTPLTEGLAAGVTLNIPTSKKANAPRIALDYSFQTTQIFDGNHALSVRISL